MRKHRLLRHPDTPSASVEAVEVEIVATDADDLLLTFTVVGTADLILPEWLSAGRSDGLWTTTCFELFLKSQNSNAYYEFNFSPSTRWAAYRFDGYRQSTGDLQLSVEPHIESEEMSQQFVLEADVDLSNIPPEALRMGLSAVIEETSNRKSYWALTHPPGRPDFHHPDCFTLELPSAGPT